MRKLIALYAFSAVTLACASAPPDDGDGIDMPELQKQVVPVVFKGLSQKSPNTISAPGELQTVENQYVRHGGQEGLEFVKRHGLTTLATAPTSAGFRLSKYDGSLVAQTGAQIFQYSPSKGAFVQPHTNTAANNSGMEMVRVGRRSILVGSSTSGTPTQTSLDIAYAGNIALYVWKDESHSFLNYQIRDGSNGVYIAAGTIDAPNTVDNIKVVKLGTNFFVFWKESNAIMGVTVGQTSFTVGTPTTVVGSGSALAGTDYDVQAGFDSTHIALMYRADSTHHVRALIDATFAVTTSISDATAADQPDVGMCWFSQATFGANLYYGTINSSSGTKIQTISATTLAISATATGGGLTTGITFAGFVDASNVPTMLVEQTSANPYDHFINRSTGASTSTISGLGLASRVFYVSGVPYVLFLYNSASGVKNPQDTYFLYNLTASQVMARAVGLEASRFEAGHVSSVAIDSSGIAHIHGRRLVSVESSAAATITTQYALVDISFSFADSSLGNGVDSAGVLFHPGGVTWEYDASADSSSTRHIEVHEQNFNVFPEPVTAAVSATSGSITAGTVSIVAVYEWIDRTGQRAQSNPSTPTSLTTTVNKGIDISLSNQPAVSTRAYRIAFYRTPVNGDGSLYFRVSPQVSTSTTFTDTSSDAALEAGEPLYTASANAGEIPNISPPAFSVVAEHKGRVFGVSSEEPNIIWFSKPYSPGTSLGFSLTNKLITAAGTGGVTAMASMDGHLILWKRDDVYVVDGDFPDATGGGPPIPEPVRNATAFGTLDPQSILLTDQGLIYHSTQNGFWLLDRSLTSQYIGAPVDDTARGVTVTSAVLTSDETQARFTTSGGTTFVLDLYFAKLGMPVWSTWTGQAAVGAVNLAGVWYTLTSVGVLKKEDMAAFADDGVAFVRKLVFADINFAGIAGYYRVWRGHLLGAWKGAHAVHIEVVDSRIPANLDTFDFDATSQPVPYELEFKLKYEKGTSKTVTITDGSGSTSEGSAWTALSFLVGLKSGLMRLPQTFVMTPS